MHVHRARVRLPQARRPKQAACVYMVYIRIHMYREVMAWHMQPAPGRLLAFAMYVYMYEYKDMVRLPQYRDDGACPGQPAPGRLFAFTICIYVHA